ncbi:MAG: hypothetical protein ACJ8J0_13900, partial [Longimicrobiaceae bacterium]
MSVAPLLDPRDARDSASTGPPRPVANGAPQPVPPRSLRREIVVGYSTLMLVSLALFAGATYLILRQTLARAATQ